MPHRIREKGEIRRRLNADRDWCLFALADLDDALFAECDWWVCGDALALVCRAVPIRPIVLTGESAEIRALLSALPERTGWLNLRDGQVEAAAGIYAFRERRETLRMVLDEFVPLPGPAEALEARHREELERLFAMDEAAGIGFAPYQLETGYFRGVRCGGELVAVAGVHVASRKEGVAGIGNVFTRPDFRGQGLATRVTSVVAGALRDAGIRTIGLNVEAANKPAVRAYERVGFRTRFRYSEGPAERCVPGAPQVMPAGQ